LNEANINTGGIEEGDMFFGLFKKSEKAEMVIKGGKIYTFDPDEPVVEAVACKDGNIMAVGEEDDIEDLIGSETEIIDLEGSVLLPGFIETCGHPVLQAFKKVCLILDDHMSQEGVLEVLAEHIKENPEKDAYFAYGFNTSFVAKKPTEETQKLLDQICDDKPVVLLDISGFEGWFNTKAMEQVKQAFAEEAEGKEPEEMPVITLSYVLHVLSPIDFEQLRASVISLAAEYCQEGVTTIFDCGAPDYLHAIYQEMILEMLQTDMLKQRFRGSLLIARNIPCDYIIGKLLQKRTTCAEINEFINCNVLKLIIEDQDDMRDDAIKTSEKLLKNLAVRASDQGFDIHIDTIGKKSIAKAFELTAIARASGSRKTHFTIAHTDELSPEELSGMKEDKELCEVASTVGDIDKKCAYFDCATDVKGAIERLTIDAAVELGVSDSFGSIEVGKKADFVAYEKNPFEDTLEKFSRATALMTIIGGRVVYDQRIDRPEEWHEMLKSKQKEMDDQMLEEDDFDDDEF